MSANKPAYSPNEEYKITVVYKSGVRRSKYFKGSEMRGMEREIEKYRTLINNWWVEQKVEVDI